MTNKFDVIVIGVGGMGSSACYHLARRGKRVLGIDRFGIPHAMGSSHGVNRIIRLAYYEDPSYVPLLRRAFELWRDLERGFGEQLLFITGSIDASHEDHFVFRESKRSCQLHGIPYEELSALELRERFPGFSLPTEFRAIYQPDGGFVMSERAIVAHVTGALEASAEIRGHEPVMSWATTTSGVVVDTRRATYFADQLIVSAGAWIGQFVPALSHVIVPERQVLGWFQPTAPDLFCAGRMPVFNLAVDEGRYYGLPVHSIPGFKFGRYHHLAEQIDPDHWDRLPGSADEDILRPALKRYFPAADGPVLSMASCMFTNTPDEHFVVDRLEPGSPVIVASPCSGHGYKFASVIGEVLADLVIDNRTGHNIDLFKLDRFSPQ